MRTPARTALTLAAFGLAAAGCTEGTTGAGPTPGATGGSASATATASPGAGGPLASCVTGDWRSTGASGEASTGGGTGTAASAKISGGSGIDFTVGPDGATSVDFTGMQPATFTVAVAGVDVTGSFVYAGTVTGSVQTGGGADATSGAWEPVGAVDWADTRVTVDLTAPVKARPLDNARIGDYAGGGAEQTGNVVDIDPLLGTGRYECQGDTLVLAPDTDSGITWTLARA